MDKIALKQITYTGEIINFVENRIGNFFLFKMNKFVVYSTELNVIHII